MGKWATLSIFMHSSSTFGTAYIQATKWHLSILTAKFTNLAPIGVPLHFLEEGARASAGLSTFNVEMEGCHKWSEVREFGGRALFAYCSSDACLFRNISYL